MIIRFFRVSTARSYNRDKTSWSPNRVTKQLVGQPAKPHHLNEYRTHQRKCPHPFPSLLFRVVVGGDKGIRRSLRSCACFGSDNKEAQGTNGLKAVFFFQSHVRLVFEADDVTVPQRLRRLRLIRVSVQLLHQPQVVVVLVAVRRHLPRIINGSDVLPPHSPHCNSFFSTRARKLGDTTR